MEEELGLNGDVSVRDQSRVGGSNDGGRQTGRIQIASTTETDALELSDARGDNGD